MRAGIIHPPNPLSVWGLGRGGQGRGGIGGSMEGRYGLWGGGSTEVRYWWEDCIRQPQTVVY